MKPAARATKEAKFRFVFSQRKAIRLKRLSLATAARFGRDLCVGAFECIPLRAGVRGGAMSTLQGCLAIV